jgi:hypothetical protein
MIAIANALPLSSSPVRVPTTAASTNNTTLK